MSNKHSQGIVNTTSKQTSPELIEKFFDNQTRELALRAQELTLQQQQDKNTFDFSKEALRFQAEDRKDQRAFILTQRRWHLLFLMMVLLLVFGLVGYALHKGENAFALEIAKVVIYVSVGSLGGYGYAKTKPAKEPNKSDTKDSE